MENAQKRKSRFFPGFVFGMFFGALLLVIGPKWWRSYVPDVLLPGGVVDGRVLEKSAEPDRLLLKLETSDGVLLATFTERLEEIALLVEKGDEITLRVPRYEPFLTDPRLERVRKHEGATGSEGDLVPSMPEPSIAPPDDTEETPAEPEPETTSSIPF